MKSFALVFTALAITAVAAAEVIITEFDAINCGSATDADGNDRDWLELHNTGGSAVNLDGWALSDDPANPGLWVFPNLSLNAGAHLLIFASDKDWRVPGVELHTNFKLSAGGGNIVLSQPDGAGGWTTVDSVTDYPEQVEGFSYGRPSSASTGILGFFETPTPGSTNPTEVVDTFVADTDFEPERGYFEAPFELSISSATPGASIIYTLDGSEPTPGNGTVVDAVDSLSTPVVSISLSSTAIVRARAVKDGMGSTNIDTHTYIFPADVLQQDASDVTQSFANWGHDGPDWEMDPRVTGHANPEDRAVASDLEKIPSVSLVMNWNELFGSDGIYIEGEGIEKRASFELLNPLGNDLDPNLDAADHGSGVAVVFGGSSTQKRWKTDKLSFRFKFCRDFESAVLGDDAVGTYSTLVLDARLNNVWNQSQNFEQRQFGDYARDAVLTDLDNALGRPSVHSQHVHLYLNGLYWGIYTLHERPDKHFAADYYGGREDDYDIVKHGPGASNFLVDGLRLDPSQPISNTNYSAGVNYLAMVDLSQADLRIPANYEALAAVLDIPALIDHILTNFYGGNYDWPQQNWYASFNRADPAGKWRFHSWDAEHVFKYVDYPRFDNVTNKFEGWDRPDGINLQLLQNPDYRFQFADAAHRYLFNGGPFAVENVRALFNARFDDIDEAIRAESARWSDNAANGRSGSDPLSSELHLRWSNIPSSLSSGSVGQSDTTDFASWYHERNRIVTNILGDAPNRATRFLAQLRNAVYGEDHPSEGQPNPLYPATDAPVFNQHGGNVPADFALTMTNPNSGEEGTIYYTTDGSDPRLPGSGDGNFFSGAVSPTAAPYVAAMPLTASTIVKARILRDGEWSALNEAAFAVAVVPAMAENLTISKIHYHPTDPTAAELAAGFDDDGLFEFFEVTNIGTETVSLDGLSMLQGLDMALLEDGVVELNPGARALFVADPDAFTFRYGAGLPLAGRFILDTRLSNGGERLHLLAADSSTIVDFTYNDKAPWPETPDGEGPSLVLMRPELSDPAVAWNWRRQYGSSRSSRDGRSLDLCPLGGAPFRSCGARLSGYCAARGGSGIRWFDQSRGTLLRDRSTPHDVLGGAAAAGLGGTRSRRRPRPVCDLQFPLRESGGRGRLLLRAG
jgi:hypothetical protein